MSRMCPGLRGASPATAVLLLAYGLICTTSAGAQDVAPEAVAASGIETQYFDTSVRPQDDFYQYVNGKWLATIDIPADRPAYGTASKLYDDSQKQLRQIIEAAASQTGATPDGERSKIGVLYNSFLDEARVERLGSKPLADELAAIEALKNKRDIAALIAHLQQIGVTVPFALSVHLDAKDTSHYVVDIQQDGLGLPDRDYYVKDDATTLRLIRHEYQLHVATMLRLLGDRDASRRAASIVALETTLARAQWNKSDSQDPLKTYNPIDIATLGSTSTSTGYDWQRYLKAAQVRDRIDYLNISEPAFIRTFEKALDEVPLPVWKSYFRWHLLSEFSAYLSKAYVDDAFAFEGTALQGIPQNQPRWRRGVVLVEQSIGQSLGRLYVSQYFSAQSKAHAEQLVGNLLAAYRQAIASLSWMSPETKAQALIKLSRITVKIGYPSRWRDYSALTFREDDLVGNVMRARLFEYRRNVDKLGKPVDHTEWEGTPQTVNAFYNPQMNEIVFPAAILQPPIFDAGVDDAVNYGGIGMIIGHEISHAFDQQGSKYDSDGKYRDWWTPQDHERFDAATRPLIAEYGAFMPLRGRPVNGTMTLSENIADNAGLAIAYRAYGLSLGEHAAPMIDGLSGAQRFFVGFAQAWREKIRDSFAVEMLQSDPHAISFVRVIGTLLNQSAFYDTFGVKPGDRMYLPPDQRVSIW